MKNNTPYVIVKRLKNILLVLDAFLILGLLSYAIILFTINRTLNPVDISVGNITVEQRLYWREIAEKICAVCNVIYILGHVLVIYNSIKRKVRFSLKTLGFYFLTQIGIALICVVPFGILDRAWFYDYIFPLWNIILTTSLLFVFSIFTLKKKM